MLSLLEAIQHLIERVYALERGMPPAAPFVIGDRGYQLLYGRRRVLAEVGSAAGGAQVLLRPDGDVLHVAIYFPDALIARLEAHPPASELCDENISEFLSFVEEVDHFLLVARKWRNRTDFSLLELELHANVTKHFVARHILRRQGRLDEIHAQWLAFHLFHRSDFADDATGVAARYRDARRLAFRYVTHLMALPPEPRLQTLRLWSEAGPQKKVAWIEGIGLPS